MARPSCEACKKSYQALEKTPPCKTCQPELWPLNYEAVRVYNRCSGQMIMSGMGGPVDIDIQAVIKFMELEKVKDQSETLQKVQTVAREVIRIRGEVRRDESGSH